MPAVTPAPAATPKPLETSTHVVKLAVILPITAVEFNDEKQTKYKEVRIEYDVSLRGNVPAMCQCKIKLRF